MHLSAKQISVARPALGRAAMVAQLRGLGVRRGGVLVVHTSFRTVRPVEDGPMGLIAALCEALGPTGTLVMPTMTGSRGADHTANTTIHLGECLAGVPYRRAKWATILADGQPQRVAFAEGAPRCGPPALLMRRGQRGRAMRRRPAECPGLSPSRSRPRTV